VKRRITYITGTRADFGLMRNCLSGISASENLCLDVIVTGMHLDENFGLTVKEVEAAGFPIRDRIPVDMRHATGAGMAIGIGDMIKGFTVSLANNRPDIVLLLGDRGEMLAGAIAAIHLNVPIVHLHGGERSGTVDEPVRHAITKLAHHHFVATSASRTRLIKMGEQPENIHVVGAPGIDGIQGLALPSREAMMEQAGFDPNKRVALLLYHPVLIDSASAGKDVATILEALRLENFQTIALHPNADAGNGAIRDVLDSAAAAGDIQLTSHMVREEFLAWVSGTDVMIGNSSAGIIEAASFKTRVINIGSRQALRERGANVFDVDVSLEEIQNELRKVQLGEKLEADNIYGDGRAAGRVVTLLEKIRLDQTVMAKSNAY
jgi:GDP/UDP-N,N'-diacetylbacillosamine 2-epimerase (hydrolysing)